MLFFVAIGLSVALAVLLKRKKSQDISLRSLSDKELLNKLETSSLDRRTKKLLEEELDERRRDKSDKLVKKSGATFFTCTVCGEVIKSKESKCSACDSPKPLCAVCQAPLEIDDLIVRLPCCQSYAHKEHIDNWISMKGHCPNCLQKIEEKDLAFIVFIDYSSA